MKIDTKPIIKFWKAFKDVIASLALILGFILITDEAKNSFCNHYSIFIISIVSIALIGAFIKLRPKNCISKKMNAPETIIEVKVGNLFFENNSLVIGFSGCFDTEVGAIIEPKTIQGQFQEKIFGNDILKLNNEIISELNSKNLITEQRPTKTNGKKIAYPIGTTISLGTPNKRYFLCAYTKMKDDCTVYSNSDFFITSLHSLWAEIRRTGQGNPVSMPIIGSNLAGLNISKMELIKFIILSFIFKSREQFITNKLTIVVHPRDKEYIDMNQLQSFIEEIAC